MSVTPTAMWETARIAMSAPRSLQDHHGDHPVGGRQVLAEARHHGNALVEEARSLGFLGCGGVRGEIKAIFCFLSL